MILVNKRVAKREKYTIGHLTVDGRKFCDILEDTDRGLRQDMPINEINKRKVYGETAIPTGLYRIRMDMPSPRYRQKAITDPYYRFCCDHMPRLINVPGFEGILMHPGSTAKDSLGCPLVGDNTVVGQITNSRTRFKELFYLMYNAELRGEQVWIEIK